MVMITKSNCIICGKKLSGKQSIFCSTTCKNKKHQSYPAQKRRGIERKYYLVKIFGGECSRCGYSGNLAALSFHHQGGKEFKLDSRSLSNRRTSEIVKEMDKCILLCNNCHAEIHNPTLGLAKLSIEPTALTAELQARH